MTRNAGQRWRKYHGLGNDYLIPLDREEATPDTVAPALVQRARHPHYRLGSAGSLHGPSPPARPSPVPTPALPLRLLRLLRRPVSMPWWRRAGQRRRLPAGSPSPLRLPARLRPPGFAGCGSHPRTDAAPSCISRLRWASASWVALGRTPNTTPMSNTPCIRRAANGMWLPMGRRRTRPC